MSIAAHGMWNKQNIRFTRSKKRRMSKNMNFRIDQYLWGRVDHTACPWLPMPVPVLEKSTSEILNGYLAAEKNILGKCQQIPFQHNPMWFGCQNGWVCNTCGSSLGGLLCNLIDGLMVMPNRERYLVMRSRPSLGNMIYLRILGFKTRIERLLCGAQFTGDNSN